MWSSTSLRTSSLMLGGTEQVLVQVCSVLGSCVAHTSRTLVSSHTSSCSREYLVCVSNCLNLSMHLDNCWSELCSPLLTGFTDLVLQLYLQCAHISTEYSTVQYNTAQYSTVQYSTVQASQIWSSSCICSVPILGNANEGAGTCMGRLLARQAVLLLASLQLLGRHSGSVHTIRQAELRVLIFTELWLASP